jgi:hypothetical protein
MELQEFYTEKLKIAKELSEKIGSFNKQHPQQYKEEDVLKQAEKITEIYNKLPDVG